MKHQDIPFTFMQINVKLPDGDRTIALDVEVSPTINNVKTLIRNKESTPSYQQRLIFADNELEDGDTLSNLSILDVPLEKGCQVLSFKAYVLSF